MNIKVCERCKHYYEELIDSSYDMQNTCGLFNCPCECVKFCNLMESKGE